MIRRVPFFAILLLALAGCAQITLVKPEPQEIGGTYSVDPQMSWNQWNSGNWQTWIPPKATAWTANGVGLDALIFYAGLEDGDRLFLAQSQDDFPTFDRDMRATDVAEFVAATLASQQFANVETENLRPAQFGSLKGFRFEFSMSSEVGLEFRGMAIGALQDGRLHLILYRATRLYYFPEYEDEVEQIFDSITLRV